MEYNYSEGECPAYEEYLKNQRSLDRWLMFYTFIFILIIVIGGGVLG